LPHARAIAAKHNPTPIVINTLRIATLILNVLWRCKRYRHTSALFLREGDRG
jgi:hypothetical protein